LYSGFLTNQKYTEIVGKYIYIECFFKIYLSRYNVLESEFKKKTLGDVLETLSLISQYYHLEFAKNIISKEIN
jgi:hypothetical protein